MYKVKIMKVWLCRCSTYVCCHQERLLTSLLSVEELKTKHGFQYSSVVGMLIFLLNTAIILHYAIRKLAKFNTLPGKQHYKAIIHFSITSEHVGQTMVQCFIHHNLSQAVDRQTCLIRHHINVTSASPLLTVRQPVSDTPL